MELIEKIARAMCANSTGTRDPDKLVPAPRGSAGLVPLWRSYEHLAQAALTAIMDAGDGVQQCDREAAKAMVFALLDRPDPDSVARTAMDYMARHRSTAAAAERASRDAEIVAWLRDQDKSTDVRDAADAIERGEV